MNLDKVRKLSNMIHIIALTKEGTMKGLQVLEILQEAVLHIPSKYREICPKPSNNVCVMEGKLKEYLPHLWQGGNTLLMIMATGIVMRCIAPLIEHKTKDPAVLVMDQSGQFLIPLLSGHLGGANAMSRSIGNKVGAVPVITTATDVQGVMALDLLAKHNDMVIENIHHLSTLTNQLLDGNKVPYSGTVEMCKEVAQHFVDGDKEQKPQLKVTEILTEEDCQHLVFRPKNLYLGIGCRRNTDEDSLMDFIHEVFKQSNLSEASIAGIFSVDVKAEEVAIIKVSEALGVDFHTFTPTELQSCIDNNQLKQSDFVKKNIGVGAVCEPAALCGSEHNQLIVNKTSKNGMTIAIAQKLDYKVCSYENIEGR